MLKNPPPSSGRSKGDIAALNAKLGYDIRDEAIAEARRKKKAEADRKDDTDSPS